MILFDGTIEIPDIKIDHNKCNLCINCIRTCPMQVFKVIDKKVVQMENEICIACRNCEVVCETGALKVNGGYRVRKGYPCIGYFPVSGFQEYKEFLKK
jgi:NAD-dependent dihydropyrimidine dehydrogenase PreA subunit